MMLYISTKFCENISKDFKVIERTLFPNFNFQKGNNSLKNAGRGMALNLCISSDDAYIFTKSCENISKSFKVFEQTWFSN